METNNQKIWTYSIFTETGFSKVPLPGGLKVCDVGCGQRKFPGSVGVDFLKDSAADIVHDLNSFPWPIKNNEFDVVLLNHVLEHVDDVTATLGELHRILRPGGRAVIQVPYFRITDAFNDPTHQHFFTAHSLDYFIDQAGLRKYKYSSFLFKQIGFWYGWPHPSKNPIKRLIKTLMHKYPDFYDQYISLLIPSECLTWELEVIKS